MINQPWIKEEPEFISEPVPEDIPTEIRIIEEQITEMGTFTAYNDHSIKVKFSDRTMLRLKKGSPIVKILDPLGESHSLHIERPSQFLDHIRSAMEFYQWAYSTPEQRHEQEKAVLRERAMVDAELARVDQNIMLRLN